MEYYKELSLLYKKVNTLRHSPKNKEVYDEIDLYIKCFFKLLDINFPNDLISNKSHLNKFTFEIQNLVFSIIDEIIILAFYMNYSDIALILSDKLIFSSICTISKDQSIGNQRYYTKKLIGEKYGILDLKIKLENYVPMNSSILKTEHGYTILCRLVNYELTQQGGYLVKGPIRKILSENVLIKTDKELNILSEHLIQDKSNYTKLCNPVADGCEDLIIFNLKDEIYFTCTTLDTNVYCRPQISIGKLDKDSDIIKRVPIESPQNRQEKNWLPYLVNQNTLSDNIEVDFIYEYHPYTIKQSKINFDIPIITNELRVTDKFLKTYNINLSRFKGSTMPVQFNDGYLIMVHETFNLSPSLRCYLHRFVELDKSMEIIKLSHPWYFESHGIEFCRSMCHSHTEDKLILTYSIHDKDAKWCEISTDYVNSLLKNIEDFQL